MEDNEMSGRTPTGAVAVPEGSSASRPTPAGKQEINKVPSVKQEKKKNPTAEMEVKEMPKGGHPENTVLFGNTPIEIFPTKFKYERNRTAAFYQVLELYPVGTILRMTEDQIGDGRDGDKAVFDWLIAVTNDEALVKKNYNDVDQTTIDKLVEIYKRVNHIKEKEEKLKNLMAPKKGA